MIKTLRGQDVDIDKTRKTLTISIFKPLDKVFSLSDRVIGYAMKGYKVQVNMPQGTQVITNESRPFQKEEIPSKFSGAEPWHRYWFMIKSEESKQERMF